MSLKRVLFDCDGVLSDFLHSALEHINEKAKQDAHTEGKPAPEPFQKHQVTGWDICEAIGMPHMWDHLRKKCGEPGFCVNLPVCDGAKDAFEKVREIAEIFVVTSPMSVPNWAMERSMWLEKHFGVKKSHVVQTEAKHVIVGDVLVDDKPENCEEWAKHHPNGLAILWNAPYNKSYAASVHNISRAFSWDDVLTLIQGHGNNSSK